ncbi:MAG: cadherin-like beta sandwich domain-containing protein [Acidobacteria bacterium]|nr:cadherin-like beta sandwich domain-containing protein [Acidobacteriota bacterium]
MEVASARRTSESGDHDEGPFDIHFGAGETEKDLQVATYQDDDADDETFRVAIAMTDQELENAGFRRGVLTFADFTILDDDARPKVTLSASPNPVPEGSTVTVTLTLTEALREDLDVAIGQSRGTSEPVDDYEHFSRITIPAGRTTATGRFATKHDVDPDDETFRVSVSHVPPALASAGEPSSVEVTIEDDDTTVITLSAEHASVAEGESNFITLSFSEPVPLDKGALNGNKHVLIPVLVTDTDSGEVLARVPHRVEGGITSTGFFAGNDVDEDGDDESVTVSLVADELPFWASAGDPSSVTYTVDDAQEATVSLSVSPARVSEGDSVTVTATLSNALSDRRSELQVPLALTAGTAEDGDFRAPRNYIEIAAGETTGTLEVETKHDGDIDPETFTVSLRPQRAQVAKGEPSSVEVTIVDDDESTFDLSVADAVAEETSQPPTLVFAVTLNRAATHRVYVNYETVDGSATGGVDYYAQAPGMLLIFEAGETRKEVRVGVIDDDHEDSGETLKLVLSNPRGAVLADAEAVGTILNDDPPSTDADLRWLLVQGASNGAGPWTKLDIGTVDAEKTDYAVTVPHRTTVARLQATPAHDRATHRTGPVSDLSAARAGFWSRGIPLEEGDNAFAAEVTAQDGTTTKTYTVTVTREARALSSNADLSGLTAEARTDGAWSALDIGVFSAGATSYAVTVPYEKTHARLTATAADENATVAGGGAVALKVDGNALSVEVTAEDGASKKTYTVTVTREARPEPLTASFENIPATHDGESAFAVDVRFSEALDGGSGPTAASFDVAYGRAKAVELVEAGVYRVSVMPKSFRDARVTLAGRRDCGAAGTVCTADGRALENTSTATVGGPVRIRIEGGTAREGRDAGVDFAVTLNRASSETVSVDYATADDSAKAGEDYEAVSGTLRFAAGETEKTLHVPVLDDDIDEGNEKFKMRLSNESGAYLRKHSPPSDGNDQEHGPDSGGAAGALRPCDRRAGGDAHRGAHGGAAAEGVQGALRRA